MGSGSSGYTVGKGGGGTSGSRDNGFKGGTATQHSIGDNLPSLKEKYELNNGRFGTASNPKRPSTRRIESDDPLATARDFYDRASKGGVEQPLASGEGVRTDLKDGTILVMREVSHSKDRSPALRIDVDGSNAPSGLKTQHIHFVERKGR